LALHLDCSRTYIGKLEAEGVPQGDGFPLDQSRVAYLRYLRREHRRWPTLITSRSSRRSMTADGLHCRPLRGRTATVIRTIKKLHPEPLPPGVYPIIGPEIATYGVVDRPAIGDDDARHLA
jgi:hypothetical protein